MKYIYILFLIFSVPINSQTLTFGNNIEDEKIIKISEIKELYNSSEKFNTSFKAKVNDVCQMKGCWMKLDLGDNNEVMVNFKDYGFFVPKNISGRAVLVSGKGFKKTISVDELKHYAFDRGDSEDLIAKINEPEIIYALTADGVLLLPMNETE